MTDRDHQPSSAAKPWSKREEAIYEIGHRDGGSDVAADWNFAFTELSIDLPDDVDAWSPTAVAAYAQSLIAIASGSKIDMGESAAARPVRAEDPTQCAHRLNLTRFRHSGGRAWSHDDLLNAAVLAYWYYRPDNRRAA